MDKFHLFTIKRWRYWNPWINWKTERGLPSSFRDDEKFLYPFKDSLDFAQILLASHLSFILPYSFLAFNLKFFLKMSL